MPIITNKIEIVHEILKIMSKIAKTKNTSEKQIVNEFLVRGIEEISEKDEEEIYKEGRGGYFSCSCRIWPKQRKLIKELNDAESGRIG